MATAREESAAALAEARSEGEAATAAVERLKGELAEASGTAAAALEAAKAETAEARAEAEAARAQGDEELGALRRELAAAEARAAAEDLSGALAAAEARASKAEERAATLRDERGAVAARFAGEVASAEAARDAAVEDAAAARSEADAAHNEADAARSEADAAQNEATELRDRVDALEVPEREGEGAAGGALPNRDPGRATAGAHRLRAAKRVGEAMFRSMSLLAILIATHALDGRLSRGFPRCPTPASGAFARQWHRLDWPGHGCALRSHRPCRPEPDAGRAPLVAAHCCRVSTSKRTVVHLITSCYWPQFCTNHFTFFVIFNVM